MCESRSANDGESSNFARGRADPCTSSKTITTGIWRAKPTWVGAAFYAPCAGYRLSWVMRTTLRPGTALSTCPGGLGGRGGDSPAGSRGVAEMTLDQTPDERAEPAQIMREPRFPFSPRTGTLPG